MALIKVYLKKYENLKKSYLNFFFIPWINFFRLTSIQGLLYMKTTTLGLKFVYSFINFIIVLPVTYVRHSCCTSQRLAKRLLEQIHRFIRLLRQKDYRGTTELNDAFKFLSRRLKYRRLYSWNSSATSVANSYMKELLQILIISIY